MPATHANPSTHPRPTVIQKQSQAAALRAHLGTVHVCSRRIRITRNRNRASRAFAHRLAGIRRKKENKEIWKEWRRLATAESWRLSGKERDGNYPKHLPHRTLKKNSEKDDKWSAVITLLKKWTAFTLSLGTAAGSSLILFLLCSCEEKEKCQTN